MYFVSVQVCKQFSCPKVTYYFCSKEVQVAPAKNAFAVLMQSQRERRLPAKVSSDKLRGDQRMFNDVVDMLGAMNIGWTPDLVGSVGENCVKVIVSALWYIDPCCSTDMLLLQIGWQRATHVGRFIKQKEKDHVK